MFYFFMRTVSLMVTHGRWDELKDFFALIRQLLAMPAEDLAQLTVALKQSDDALATSVAANQPTP